MQLYLYLTDPGSSDDVKSGGLSDRSGSIAIAKRGVANEGVGGTDEGSTAAGGFWPDRILQGR